MSQNVVIIGGVAAGPKTAAKIMRLNPDANVTVIEKGEFLSYAGCGLPYYVSGIVKEQAELMSTPVGTVRDPIFFQKVKNFQVRNHTEARCIDREAKKVCLQSCETGAEEDVYYDQLVLCTGASPFVPPVPGVDLNGVYTLHGVEDAEGIRSRLEENRALDVVIVGGGLIGVEMTEALVSKGCRVTILEMQERILPMLDPEMALLVEQHMESHGVRVMTGTTLTGIEGEDSVKTVATSNGNIPADMVIMSVGVRPNVTLAKDAGLAIGPRGGIQTNERMQTSDPDIYAAGDCVESTHLLTGESTFVPLGSTANKQGRVAAMNICQQEDRFPGVLGSSVCKVFDFNVARTGLSEQEAKKTRT